MPRVGIVDSLTYVEDPFGFFYGLDRVSDTTFISDIHLETASSRVSLVPTSPLSFLWDIGETLGSRIEAFL